MIWHIPFSCTGEQGRWEQLTAAEGAAWESLMHVQKKTAFFQLSGFKPCSSAVKPLWQSWTRCLPMNLNGLHLLHSSVYSEHDFIHDLLIKQISVNSFLKTPLPLYQLTFYKLTWLIWKAWKMRKRTKNIRMKTEVTISGCGNSFYMKFSLTLHNKRKKILRERKIQLTVSTFTKLSVGFKITRKFSVKLILTES